MTPWWWTRPRPAMAWPCCARRTRSASIAPSGTVKRQAGKVRAMLRDGERTALVCVATPEEMPVNETLELQDQLRRGGRAATPTRSWSTACSRSG